MLEKQSEIDNLKTKVKELVNKKNVTKGSSELQTECEKLEKRWIDLLVGVKNHLGFLHNLKEFQESQLLLQNWLVQKKKMFSVLGPIASDPRLVSSQVQQVQVMRDEFTSQKDFMERLNELAKVVCQYLQTSGSSSLKITEQMDVIHHHWEDLSSKLIEREKNLEAASGMAKDFHKTLTDLQVKLQQISDTFDSFNDKGFSHEVLLKKLMALEEDLEKQRTHLTDADSVCEQLCDVLSDSASKTDIKYKVSILEKMYSTLRKKIDIKRAETESSLKEDKLFYKSCEEIQSWLKEMESSCAQHKPLSTDIQKLFKMSEEYEQLYKQIMGREHEVHLCLSKGTEILPKLTGKPETTSLKTRLENIKKQWEKLKKTAIDRHTCLQSCIENSKKYHAATEKFTPWLNSEEEKFKSRKPAALKREKLNKELKETQTLKSDLSLHVQEFENICNLGEGLLSSCEADTESVKKELDVLKKKWRILNNDITVRMQSLEEMSQILLEHEEKIRDLQHSVQRLEDRLRSHDALGDMSCDPVLLNRLQALLQEAVDMKPEFKKVKDFVKMIIEKADKSCDSSEIFQCIESLESKHEALRKELESRCTTLNASYKIISIFMEHIKDIRSDLNSLDEEFDNMQPIAHDLKFLKIQLKDIEEFHSNLLKTKHKFSTAEKECKTIEKQEHILDSKSYVEQMKNLNRQIIRLEEHVKTRETAIKTTITRIESFYAIYSTVMSDLNAVLKEAAAFETIGGDVDIIRSQQQAFKKLCNSRVIPLSKKIVEVNKLGQGLVQTATSGVDTSEMEQQIEKLNTSWNSLQESINEKEKKLDVALLQSGKFQEALSGVQKWLNDTEEMVSNQKPPSSDFKVVKAQVQEQKFLKKMLLDRQNSVIGLKTMGTELMSTTKATELEQAENLMKTITVRFEELISTAEERMTVLEKTLPFAQQFQDIFIPLMDWMDTAEKRIIALSFVPVNDEQIKAMVKEHEKLTSDIESHRKYLIELNTVSEKLKQVISTTESETLIQKVMSINEKFTEISHSCENIGVTLKEAQKGITSFTTTYTKVISWIEKTTVQLTHFQVLSVYSDKLQIQFKDLKKLKETLDSEQKEIARVISSGEEIMKLVSGEDAIQMKEKLDSLNMKLSDVSNKLKERLKSAEESLPLVESFYSASDKLTSWLDTLERSLKLVDNSALDVQAETIKQLEESISEYRSVLEIINHTGPRLCQLSPGEGAIVIENLMSRANHRFEKVSEQVQRKAERIQLALQRKYDVVSDIDELFEWFQETEKQIAEAEGLTSEPNSLITLLKEEKALNDEINVQKNRVRDSIAAAKKLMRESSSEDLSFIHEKIETLKNQSNNVSLLCQERLSALEQAVPLAQHFFETHTDLGQWLDEAESEAELLEAPALNSHQIKKQQDRNKGLIQEVQEHKPLVDKLNKTGSALTKLCRDEESDKLEGILESDNSRYNALRKILREHQNALEEALQATSQFSDKLEGMLSALTSTADQLHNAEPISAHPERIQEQINDNKAVLQDLDKRTITLEAVKKAADDVIVKASAIDEPAVRDIKIKLDRLNDLWATIQTAARNRGKSLEEALIAAEKFWDELTAVMNALKELQGNLSGQEPPAVEPAAVQQQQEVLQEIKQEITQTKPEVDHCRQAGQNLMQLCGEPDKPEVKKHIEDLDSVWENVTTLYAKREQNLIDAMEKAMVFHDTLQNLLEFLDTVEDKFSKLGAVASDIDSVKGQINQLKDFKLEVDPHMVQVESLNRQAQELMERTSPDQAVAIREPLADINKRWDDLLKSIVERQQEMENTLLKLGQFQHALEELMIWISKTEKTLDELKPVFGDPQVIEVVLAKHKVITNDIQAHQTSIDTINRAGHEFVDSDRGSEDAKFTHNKLQNLNVRWQHLQSKSADLYKELEDALKEAQQFHQDIQDLIMWLNDIDGHLATSKPVGGLPETAKDQLNRFMDLYNELDTNRYKIENILQQGQNYMKRSGESSTKTLQHNLRTLKQKWDSVLNKANDRKIKLEIALRDATEFHEALQKFVEWLTNAEKYITSLKPVSRHMKAVLEQIEEHRNFQKDVGAHREVMLNLDKKGTHLKYFSQKQDVILIKNLLISVQHRWERVVSRAAERTRALDHGYKESKEFHDAWTSLSAWLDEAEKLLDTNTVIGNDPLKIKKLLTKHKEFQRTLGSKQVTYDATMKSGRILKDKCPKQDVPLLQDMMDELKVRWNKVCAKSVNRQRRLEEALLYSGQFKEAVMALIDWFDKTIATLSETKAYHGDLDTVTSLLDQHKSFEEELKNRGLSLESVCKTALDLKKEASSADAESLASQVDELNSKWKKVSELSEKRKKQLDEAYHLAEELHRMVHILLEWLSEAEMKLRFVGPLPEDEESTKKQILDHENFLNEMEKQEVTKNNTLEIAHDILKKCHPDGLSVIRHWITIIQSRWDEIFAWAKQRDQRLRDHLLSLKDINDLLEELLKWLINAESTLTTLEAEPLPDDLPSLDELIKEHQTFMNDMSKRQTDVEKISKAFSPKRQNKGLLPSHGKEKTKEKIPRSSTPASFKTSTPLRSHLDSDIKHPRAKLLLDKWRSVWLLAMERQRRLQDKYNYLLELDRIKHFDFNEWRKRYLGWMNNKKSRIMDQFRKIDKNNDGKVTKQEFIDGILKSKFATSQLEMERVADIFDRNGDGFIDTKEYIETLRPEREGGPKTEAEKIQDEVQRQVAKCTCVHRFKVYQVGEGKYRFGDSQKLRLVRILRSTVMVRVGGGWVALDEFLVKNDPCRAKGRTNLELREQFILADGVSQSMAPFKPKPSPNSSVSSQSGTTTSMPSAGPITKIREKSERSTPMRQSRSSAENSSDISGPSFSETDSYSNRSGLSRMTPSSAHLSPRNTSCKSSSRPSSRQGSRPSSRAPSDLSQDGVQEYKRKQKQSAPGNGIHQKLQNASSKVSKPASETKIPSIKTTVKQPSNVKASRKESWK
ncbi:microtubule-actin cross-linking factor 1-like isoform X1 [Stegodyphus dumicola]|uniref:microtubule-actin cross-linking factor 1-like isoform X1 n=1 Tax=Stegodyphus dumicola TaxID=202533 RepID=UPI0015AF21B4|nr:microtubule-actin cross-linking factor 1-like isoform X1 [Stegodyphus dumicola]